eukprot:s951_g6.t1
MCKADPCPFLHDDKKKYSGPPPRAAAKPKAKAKANAAIAAVIPAMPASSTANTENNAAASPSAVESDAVSVVDEDIGSGIGDLPGYAPTEVATSDEELEAGYLEEADDCASRVGVQLFRYHEGTALVRINLRSQDTGEFMNIEVKLEFYAAESLATIKLEAACRQVVRHKIAVANPLMQPARFTGTASEHFFRFHPETLEVPPRSEKTMELIFRPLEEGDGEAEVMLKSEQLGTYPYTVNWRATPAGLERALVLKAPLGGSVVESFKFLHYAKGAVKYSAKVEAAPGQKGPSMDFCLESAEVTAPAVTSEAQPVELGVRFQPSMLGECRAMLVITGAGGGEYKALLTGFAQPPQPQGPITIMNGKQGVVEFRNPFDKPTDFSLQVDNPCFVVPMRAQRTVRSSGYMLIDPQKTVQISINFKSDRPQGGRLIISCDKVSTPWIFFLKGEL